MGNWHRFNRYTRTGSRYSCFISSKIDAKYGMRCSRRYFNFIWWKCNPKNAAELFAQHDIDGGLIGGASLKSRDFVDIVKTFNS
jgi:triosephosphate isomerase